MGSIAPSSRALTRRMLHSLELDSDKVVVELGPGTGVFSRELINRMGGRGKLILVERGEALARQLQEKFPEAIVVCDCVSNLEAHLKELGIQQVDYIVSGLPWTIFPKELQERALSQVARHLKPGGIFVTFIYIHGTGLLRRGLNFERRVYQFLGRVEKSRPVWLNLPPARVWTWKRPDQGSNSSSLH